LGTLDRSLCDSSDHQPIWITIQCSPPGKSPTAVLRPTQSIKLKRFTIESQEKYHSDIVSRVPDITPTSTITANFLLDSITASIMQATIRQSSHRKHPKRKRFDGWSPTMIYYSSKLRFLTSTLSLMSRSYSPRKLLKEMHRRLRTWSVVIKKLSPAQKSSLPADPSGIRFWSKSPTDPWCALLINDLYHCNPPTSDCHRTPSIAQSYILLLVNDSSALYHQ